MSKNTSNNNNTVKPLYKSKTFWSGIALIMLGLYMYSTGEIITGSQLIFTGLGLIGIRDAIKKLQEQ